MTEENNRKINECKNEIEKISIWINENKLDSNIKFLVSYAVIKASGTIEVVFKSMMYDFLADNSRDETKNYLTKMIIDSSYNPSTSKMIMLLEQIDMGRKNEFIQRMKDLQAKMDLNSLVQLRNDIAHGRSIYEGIATIKRFYNSGIDVLNELDAVLQSENRDSR